MISTDEFVLGVDVSDYQTPEKIQWEVSKALSAVEFCYAKATEGGLKMKSFPRHVKRCRDAGIVVGFYHFAWCTGKGINNPEQQAVQFHEYAGDVSSGDLPPALDFEPPYNDDVFPARKCIEWCQRFITKARELFGVTPVLYTGSSYWKHRLHKTAALKDCKLWQASPRYKGWDFPGRNEAPTSMAAPKGPWETVSIWQFSHKGFIHGYNKKSGSPSKIDRNMFLGSHEEFRRFCIE